MPAAVVKRSYRQHCALARALDVVGERWTLLVVRELLTGPRRYSELLENLPGMGTNLLAARLKDLIAERIVERGDGGYRLTERGRELEDAVLALCRFGAPYLAERDASHLWRPSWNALALKYAFDPARGRGLDGVVEFRVGQSTVQARFADGTVETSSDGDWAAAAVLDTDEETFLGLAQADLELRAAIDAGRVRVSGDRRLLERSLGAFELPRAAST